MADEDRKKKSESWPLSSGVDMLCSRCGRAAALIVINTPPSALYFPLTWCWLFVVDAANNYFSALI